MLTKRKIFKVADIKNHIIMISGPMTGYQDNNRPALNALEHDINLCFPDAIVLNPAVLPAGMSWEEYMVITRSMVEVCNIILMMTGWEKSRGAKDELGRAINIGREVILEAEFREYLIQHTPDFTNRG